MLDVAKKYFHDFMDLLGDAIWGSQWNISWVFSRMSRMFLTLPFEVPMYVAIFSWEMSPGFCSARNLNKRLACVWLSDVIEDIAPISWDTTFFIIPVMFLQIMWGLVSNNDVGNPPYFKNSSQSVVEYPLMLIKSWFICWYKDYSIFF